MTAEKKIPVLEASAVALGYFDGLHTGHQAVIAAAFRGEGTRTVLSVGRPHHAAAYPGGAEVGTSLLTGQERRRVLGELGAERLVAPPFGDICDMSGGEFFERILLERLHAVRVSCGYNYRFGRNASCGAEELERMCRSRGVVCDVVPEVTCGGITVSSSAIREALAQGDIELVNRMLGRRYGYAITVTHGLRLGRTLGAPTINQVFPEGLVLPRFGVYASVAFTDEASEPMYAVTNIGVKPTVGAEAPLSETWIPDFSGDLYDRSVRVELVGFIRAEKRFDSLEELKNAIHRDAAAAREAAKRTGAAADH